MKTKMRIEDVIKTWETSEFGLATFLVAKNIPFLGIKPTSDPRRKLFVFQNVDDIPALVQEFWSGKALCDPLNLLNSEKELKRLLHADTYTFSSDPEERSSCGK